MMVGLWAHLPTLRCVDQKQHDSRAPASLLTQSHSERLSLFTQMKKALRGKCFAYVEEVKQKTAEALKSIKIDEFENCFEQWKKCLNRCIASMESTLKVTEV